MSSLVTFTNNYAMNHIEERPSYMNNDEEWTRTNMLEMYRLNALISYMGLVKMPSIDFYWSTSPLFSGSWARAMIPTRRRFKVLLRFLHLSDNRNEDPDDRLRKVGPVNHYILERSQALYQPFQSVSVDERMI